MMMMMMMMMMTMIIIMMMVMVLVIMIMISRYEDVKILTFYNNNFLFVFVLDNDYL